MKMRKRKKIKKKRKKIFENKRSTLKRMRIKKLLEIIEAQIWHQSSHILIIKWASNGTGRVFPIHSQ